ncbi:hypothetical protein [Allosphingosinicella sp.]|jgi:hypothetical protein|uniref:hypothetical protein n=1 Tax=Allosphingosinicella sp. TaxID=2823234 RepID=UPI002F10F3BA
MQRVRIGLTGLGFVFVLVLLATVLVRPSEEVPITENMIEQQRNGGQSATGNGRSEAKEPLAVLGVAPGNAETNNLASPAEGTIDPREPR